MKHNITHIIHSIRTSIALWIGGIKMQSAIKGAIHQHKKIAKTTGNQRHCRQYVILLNIPVKRGKKVRMREELYWCSIKTFKRIRERGWLPANMVVTDLNQKAFYVTDMNRDYVDEKAVCEYAKNKYKLYLKSQLS